MEQPSSAPVGPASVAAPAPAAQSAGGARVPAQFLSSNYSVERSDHNLALFGICLRGSERAATEAKAMTVQPQAVQRGGDVRERYATPQQRRVVGVSAPAEAVLMKDGSPQQSRGVGVAGYQPRGPVYWLNTQRSNRRKKVASKREQRLN